MEIYFSQFWMLANPRSRYEQIPCLVGTHFVIHNCHFLVVFSHDRREKQFYGKSFVTVLIPFMRALPSLPSHFALSLPSSSILMEIRFQHIHFIGAETSRKQNYANHVLEVNLKAGYHSHTCKSCFSVLTNMGLLLRDVFIWICQLAS